MRHVLSSVCLAALLLGTVATARANSIDFEAQGAGKPPGFTGILDSPLVIGIATFTGGQLLFRETGATDQTAVYATSNLFGGAYTNPLTISLSNPVSGFSLQVTNNLPDTYAVADNLGGSQSAVIGSNTTHLFNLSDTGITSVTIRDSSLATGLWDFAIDNVQFTPTTSQVPEPSTTLLLVSASGIAAVLARRKRV